ncbi:hypothetical protein AX17_007332 [Amanita inopinata Kibby_2008]|nr:hypothetical protein AX17_007332 [Amanita inopinata Kibby_2008]
MSTPTTPRTKTGQTPTTPSTSRGAAAHVMLASPHYATTRRHSLYGVEDRVIIDPGSRVWKVGFSGEGRPRDVLYAGGPSGGSLWSLKRPSDPTVRAEEDKLLEVRLQKALRSVFHDSLLTDPKARKVILVEHPLLPIYIKDIMARVLFENQVPSISFASSHLLSLFAAGRITGLVLDCGHLESVALPIFAARPLYSQLRTTPMAGAGLTSHLRALLLKFATYLPPPTTLSSAANIPAANRATRVPQEVLTDQVVEEIKTRCCFVGTALNVSNVDFREITPLADDASDSEPPLSDSVQSESGQWSTTSSQLEAESEFSEATGPGVAPPPVRHGHGENYLQALASMYTRHSTATDLHMRVTPPLSQQTGTGMGTLVIPGWLRERAAEVLFEGGDMDESSIAEVILDSLLKVPIDLRKTMASSILVIGGTAMLPGFILRLQTELIRALAPPQEPHGHSTRSDRPLLPPYDKYAALRPLKPYFAILNNPSPPPPASSRASANAGRAPAFIPATAAWVGGSLAGALKTGGAEVARENWDEVDLQEQVDEDGMEMDVDTVVPKKKNILPDWTRSPLPMGAAPARQLAVPPIVPATPRVGA